MGRKTAKRASRGGPEGPLHAPVRSRGARREAARKRSPDGPGRDPDGDPGGPKRSTGRAVVVLGLLAAGFLLLVLALFRTEPEIAPPTPVGGDVPIEFPPEMWNLGIGDTVRVRVLVNEDGTVDVAHVRESSGHEAFDSAAVASVRAMRFLPARQDGDPVKVWTTVPVAFDGGAAGAGPGGDVPAAAEPPPDGLPE